MWGKITDRNALLLQYVFSDLCWVIDYHSSQSVSRSVGLLMFFFSVWQKRGMSWLVFPWWTVTENVCWMNLWNLRTILSTTSPGTHTHTQICLKMQPQQWNLLSGSFSGITAAMLWPVRTTLRDIQVQLRKLLPSDAVLVGHSINNDLMALKVSRHQFVFILPKWEILAVLKVFYKMFFLNMHLNHFQSVFGSWKIL